MVSIEQWSLLLLLGGIVPVTYFAVQAFRHRFNTTNALLVVLGFGAILIGMAALQQSGSLTDSRPFLPLPQHIGRPLETVLGMVGPMLLLFGLAREARRWRVEEEALTRRANLDEELLNSLRHAVLIAGDDGRILYANTAAERLLGVDRDHLIGEQGDSYLSGQSPTGAQMTRRELGRIASIVDEASSSLRTMQDRVVSVRERALSGASGISGSVQVVEDITGLARFTRMTQEFVATVAHELRTPLTSIRGYLELVLEGDLGKVPASQKEALGIVLQHATQLERLISEYLDLSHIELGTVPLSRETFDLRPAIEEAILTLRPALDEHEMAVHLDLPDVPTDLSADRGRIVQVLLNLLSNALKYTPAGGRIDLRLSVSADRVLVEVEDSGVGIPEDEQPYIFLQFFRSSSATQAKAPGAGLGLTIAKSIVELHGGEMWFTSQPGKGSTFSFWLPRFPAIDVPA